MSERDLLGNPTSALSRKRIKKSSTETWGDRHRHEFFEFRKNEEASRKSSDDSALRERLYTDLCAECSWQLQTFPKLEHEFQNRCDLKNEFFLNPTRIKRITFGSAAFYKRVESHIESLRSLNKTMEAIRKAVDAEGLPQQWILLRCTQWKTDQNRSSQ